MTHRTDTHAIQAAPDVARAGVLRGAGRVLADEPQTSAGTGLLRHEIAARCVARDATLGYPDTKAGRALAEAYVEANWRRIWDGWQRDLCAVPVEGADPQTTPQSFSPSGSLGLLQVCACSCTTDNWVINRQFAAVACPKHRLTSA